ncbi:hypothetical protein PIROE2DRAFT_11269 [Piromyces sp. E2]|nr:hypothetical protein PIROE2DRAFT_11269 [Piromyces sp. E2]|eukprot:OUM62419.1 hypothetical protein PIROE2DRAFT_11269 [Piromyces sp. E2]
MVRDTIILGIPRDIYSTDGFYVSDTIFIEVILNGDYRGIYILAEQPEFDKRRIEDFEPKKDYEGTDISYLLEYDRYAFSEKPLNKFENITIKNDINSQALYNFDYRNEVPWDFDSGVGII